MTKKTWLMLFLAILAAGLMASKNTDALNVDEITGAWQLDNVNETHALLFMDGYFTHTVYEKSGRRFIQTRGGTYSITNNTVTVHVEFDTKDKEQVGQKISYPFIFQKDQLSITINGNEINLKRIDDGNANLAGVWKITARKQGDTLQSIHQTGTRKTVKILTSTRFQWAAIDPGAKSFMGTGGGTYTFKDGKYTENIEFFSRDSSRVGSSLSFDGKLESGNWHHSGLSSRGEPIYEVWSRKK